MAIPDFDSHYRDTSQFFELIGDFVPICLTSDADEDMILPLINQFDFDEVFISEQVKAYKNQPEGEIFKEVVNH